MQKNPWYHKYSFIVFLFIAVIGIWQAVRMMVAPESGYALLEDFGYPVPYALSVDLAGTAFFLFLIKWIGAVLLGSDFLTACIALTAWRKGEKWAWFAFLYWPFLFAFHFSLYLPGPHKNLPIFMLILVVITLAGNARRFFAGGQNARQKLTANPQM